MLRIEILLLPPRLYNEPFESSREEKRERSTVIAGITWNGCEGPRYGSRHPWAWSRPSWRRRRWPWRGAGRWWTRGAARRRKTITTPRRRARYGSLWESCTGRATSNRSTARTSPGRIRTRAPTRVTRPTRAAITCSGKRAPPPR